MPIQFPQGNGPKKPIQWGKFSKTLAFWVLLLLIPVIFITYSGGGSDSPTTVTYSQYDHELEQGNVTKATIQAGRAITGEFRNKVVVDNHAITHFNVRLPVENSSDEVARLRAKNVQIDAEDARPSLSTFLITFLPYLLLIGLWIFIFRQMQQGGAKAFSFGKSKAKLFTGDGAGEEGFSSSWRTD